MHEIKEYNEIMFELNILMNMVMSIGVQEN